MRTTSAWWNANKWAAIKQVVDRLKQTYPAVPEDTVATISAAAIVLDKTLHLVRRDCDGHPPGGTSAPTR